MNSFYPPATKSLFLNDSPTILLIINTKQKYSIRNNQISNYNRIVRGFSIKTRPKIRKEEREREGERESWKREKLLPLTNNPTHPLITNPINRRSRISISYRPLPVPPILPPSRIPLIIGERDRRIVRWREIGFRLHHRYRVARPKPSFPPPPPRVSRRIRLGGLVWGRVGRNVARDRRGASAFQPPPQIFTGYELGNRLAAAITGQIWYKRGIARPRLIVS